MSEHLTVRVVRSDGSSATISVSAQMTCSAFITQVIDGATGEHEILCGYPPSRLEESEEAVSTRVRHNDTVRVRPISDKNESHPSSARKTSKKKDAVSRSVASAIAKGKQNTATSSASKRTLSTSNPRAVERSVAAAVKAKASPVTSPLTSAPRIATLTSSAVARRKRGKVISLSSEEDVSEKLLAAAGAGALGADTTSKFLRDVYRRAVEKQYDSSKAVSRCTAATEGTFTTTHLGDSKVSIQYSRAGSRRANVYTDEVTLLPLEAISLALKMAVSDGSGEGRELLKPVNMSGCSPRVFWSLVLLFGGDLSVGLSRVFPEERDWRWLHERKRTLSAKAEENLRQQRRKAGRAAPADLPSSDSPSSDSPSGDLPSVDLPSGESKELSDAEGAAELLLNEEDAASAALLELPSTGTSLSLRALADADPSSSLAEGSSEAQRVHAAQRLLVARFWTFAASRLDVSAVELREALGAVGVHGPREVAIWRHAVRGLAQSLADRMAVSEESLLLVCRVAQCLLEKCLWLSVYEEMDDDGDNDDGDEDEEYGQWEERMRSEGWLLKDSENEHIGRRVRIMLSGEDDGGNGNHDDGNHDDGNEEMDGVVVAYLPPDEQEPMALWKTRLSDGQLVDLELSELLAALR